MPAFTYHLLPRLWALLAEAEPDRRGAIRKFWWLWIALFLLCVLLVRMVAAIGKRRRRAVQAAAHAGPAKPIKDAWEEAGKRAEPLSEEEIGGEDEA